MENTQIQTQQITALDTIAKGASLAFAGGGSFESVFAVADAINALRDAITPPMMQRFMALQNTALGFRTDRDPKQWNKKDSRYNEPYPQEVVKETVIEMTLRGLQPIGNQFNIIASRGYITREGYMYLLKKLPGFADFKPVIGIPHNREGGSIVACKASWTMNGKPDSCECELAIRVNDGMGADAIVGKAQRKLLKRVYDQATGCDTPDGEADDVRQLTDAKPKTDTSALFGKDDKDEAAAGLAPTDPPKQEAKAAAEPTATAEPPIQDQIGQFMADAGVSFDDFTGWLQTTGRVKDATVFTCYADLPEKLCRDLQADAKAMAKCVKLYGKAEA